MTAVAAALLTTTALSAQAAPGQRAGKYATITTAPAAVSLAPGFPDSTYTTTAPPPSTPVSATIGAGTPPGQLYGTSSGSSYLSFGPVSNTAPSTTTFTFAAPTPTSGWSFILGDIDAESITISAAGPAGSVTGDQLGFQGGFNYASTPAAITAFDPDSGVLTGVLSPTGQDTNGAAGWFSPSVPITTLSITSTRIDGSPLAQLWFVGHTASLAGNVTDASGAPVPGATVVVADSAGQPLPGAPTATTDENGAFDIPELFPQPVTLVATEDGREDGPALTVSPIPNDDGQPVFATAAAVRAGDPIVQAPPVTAPAATAPELAATGVTAPPWLIVGAAAAVPVGAALAVIAGLRRRRAAAGAAAGPSIDADRESDG
ncbi:carboxypeptidase-like regulatory domain-containing protein [Schumannella soli]|uniref:carboxypeptidase-like regulatory domain-containing protein n=1 Tax=Schumannella soli TaxID=2590779 RepID=UPI0015E872AC|nr:carboxypeptidase-like regulatory domain-containing protein [Schumannella soli]